jgi:hypothetical protein
VIHVGNVIKATPALTGGDTTPPQGQRDAPDRPYVGTDQVGHTSR